MPYTTETVEYIESVRRTWFERLFTRPWEPLRSHNLERRTKVVRNYAPLKAAPLAAPDHAARRLGDLARIERGARHV